ncbi:hypothetical protein D3C80_809910 [compost metagenome]
MHPEMHYKRKVTTLLVYLKYYQVIVILLGRININTMVKSFKLRLTGMITEHDFMILPWVNGIRLTLWLKLQKTGLFMYIQIIIP